MVRTAILKRKRRAAAPPESAGRPDGEPLRCPACRSALGLVQPNDSDPMVVLGCCQRANCGALYYLEDNPPDSGEWEVAARAVPLRPGRTVRLDAQWRVSFDEGDSGREAG